MTDRILDEAPQVSMTVAQARDASEAEIFNLLAEALDEAQAPVFQGDQPFNYVVIKIVK